MLKWIPCSIYRGGSSKAAFFLESDLPASTEERAVLFQKIMGGNDPKQIDGLGGAQVVTSKVAVVGPSRHEGCDVDYTFVQVYPNKPGVDLSANCGNISSAVGLFAIEKGLVSAVPDRTKIRIYNTNTRKAISQILETPGGKVTYEGDYRIAGVKGTGAKIELAFEEPSGAITGKFLPTGSACDTVTLPYGREVRMSVVDCSSLFVFVLMEDLGLTGRETNDALENMPGLLGDLEYIRGTAAARLHMVDAPEEAAAKSAALPKIALVGRPTAYSIGGGKAIDAEAMDLRVCMMTLGKPHKSFAVTGAMCIAAATAAAGSVVHELFPAPGGAYTVRLGNPAGVMEAGVDLDKTGDIRSVTAYRTARLLMTGTAYYTLEEEKCENI